MIELFSILLQVLTFLLIFSFPFNPSNLNKLVSTRGNSLNYIDCYLVNIVFILNLLLFFSFLNIKLEYIFIVLLVISIFFTILNRNYLIEKINKKNLMKFIFFIIIFYSMCVMMAHAPKLEWDGFHWISKSLVFVNNQEIQTLQNADMPMYPHLGGYLWALFWKNSYLELEYFGRFFPIFFYLISIFSIFNLLKIKSEKIIFILIFTIIYLTYDQYLFAGYQEYYIFSLLVASARFITIIDFTQKINYRKFFLIFGIMSLMMWFKDEGIFYFLIFASLLLFMINDSLIKKFILFSVILLMIVIQHYLQKNIIGIYGFHTEVMNEEILRQLLDIRGVLIEIMAISKHLLIGFIKYPLWFFIFISFGFFLTLKSKKNIYFLYFFYAFILNILLIYAIYLREPGDVEFTLSVTLDRLLFQTSGFYLIIFIYMLNKIKFNKNNF